MATKRNVMLVGFGVVVVLAIVLGAFADFGPRNSHDEPLVIDNPGVVVSRDVDADEREPEHQEGNDPTKSKRWKIHESNRFRDLHIWVTQDQQERFTKVSLAGITDVVFELVRGNGTPADMLSARRKGISIPLPSPFPNISKKLHLELNSIPFKKDRTLKDDVYTYTFQSDTEELHVKQVNFDDTKICLWGETPPYQTACTGTPRKPQRVHIVLCVEPDSKNPKSCPAQENRE